MIAGAGVVIALAFLDGLSRIDNHVNTLVEHAENTHIFDKGSPELQSETYRGIAHNAYYGKLAAALRRVLDTNFPQQNRVLGTIT